MAPLVPLGEAARHFWLAQRMAKTTNTDLVAAMAAGDLSQERWAQMVKDCRACTWSEGCVRWLDRQAGAPVLTAPEGCVNHSIFLKLKGKQEGDL